MGPSPMTSDEQEALSRKYSAEAAIVLRLSSGRFAIFNRGYELHKIVEVLTSDDLTNLPPVAAAQPLPSVFRTKPLPTYPHVTVDLGDF